MPTFLEIDGLALHVSYQPGAGRPVVFSNSLGTDFRIWDDVIARLQGRPVLRLDKRGHGLSDNGPTTIPRLAQDTAEVMEHFDVTDALVCGVSVGGLITQELGRERPDLASRLILSNTGLKIGNDEIWNDRIETAETAGTAAMADATMERWFSPAFHAGRPADLAGYRTMLCRTPGHGYAAVGRAIRDCDLRALSPSLTQPVSVIAGTHDNATPPALNRALADAIPGATYTELNTGHLPSIEDPDSVAEIILGMG